VQVVKCRGYQARLAELGPLDPENPLLKVDINALQRHGSTDPQTCDDEQSKRAMVGPAMQFLNGWQANAAASSRLISASEYRYGLVRLE